jgi:glutathione peroxidase
MKLIQSLLSGFILTAMILVMWSGAVSRPDKTVYDFSVQTIDGRDKSLWDFRGNVLLVVNTASQCGNTPQYKGLQELFMKYKNRGFLVLGFPSNQFGEQEPGTNEEIRKFCDTAYGVTFPMFSKIDVNGPNAHPLYKFLTHDMPGVAPDTIKWNFAKFLIDRNGNVFKRYAPKTQPSTIADDIEKLLDEAAK